MTRKRTGQVTPRKGFPSQRSIKTRSVAVLPGRSRSSQPGRKFFGFSDRSFEARNRAFHALSRMRRENLSLWEAASTEETTAETVRKYLPAALRRKFGKWVATKSDNY